MYDDHNSAESEGVAAAPVAKKPIIAGDTVTLPQLLARNWSYGEIDAAVRAKSLTPLSGRTAWVANRNVYY